MKKDVTDAGAEQLAVKLFIDEPIVSMKEAKSAPKTLRTFTKRCDNVDDEVFSAKLFYGTNKNN